MILRHADHCDCDWWLAVRNDPASQAASLSTGPITPEAHRHWWARMMAADDVRLYVAEVRGERVAYGRLDMFPDGETARVSIAVDPAHRGCGYATPLIQALMREPDVWPMTLLADVRRENERSALAFTRAGFRRTGSRDGVDTYQWSRDMGRDGP